MYCNYNNNNNNNNNNFKFIIGIGIVGKEGKQASLAADFSINQFQYLASLLLWHGRNSCMFFFFLFYVIPINNK